MQFFFSVGESEINSTWSWMGPLPWRMRETVCCLPSCNQSVTRQSIYSERLSVRFFFFFFPYSWNVFTSLLYSDVHGNKAQYKAPLLLFLLLLLLLLNVFAGIIKSVLQLKPWGSLNAGREGSVCNRFSKLVRSLLTVINTNAMLTAIQQLHSAFGDFSIKEFATTLILLQL